ncbi:hypothetical protein PAXINDRAFT_19369 [Paxillus involutus ATCC 200175]|nr:hypothetical protein PAXINDRAFT_19369 [Paxillus involutus ATCC 200175]
MSSRMYDPYSSSPSPGLYVPVHRHNRSLGVPSSYTCSRPSKTSSPPPSTSSSTSPALHLPLSEPHASLFIHTLAALLPASASARLSPEQVDAIHAAAPESAQSTGMAYP